MDRLMCPPTYFRVDYSINPWMDTSVPIDSALAERQWHDLRRLLEDSGDVIHLVDAAPGLSDMTFAGDAGLVWRGTYIPSNFVHPERRGEVEHVRRWFEQRDFSVVELPADIAFEGLGDLVFHEGRAIVGHGVRSDARAIEALRDIIPELDVIASMTIVDDRYFHVAMALAFIDAETVVYYPPAFTPDSVDALNKAVRSAIPVSEVDANHFFACNNLVLGDQVVLDGCTDELRASLAKHGYDALPCPMSEFKKSGGSLRCLVLSFMGGFDGADR